MLQGQLIQSRRQIMFFQGLWKSSAWHWSRRKEASSGWFKGWMDLKGMPNGFEPTKAPDEKPPFSKQQTVFELATAFAPCYLWWGRCAGQGGFRWQFTLEKRLRKRWVWELNRKLSFDICWRCWVNLYQNVQSALPVHLREWARKGSTQKTTKKPKNNNKKKTKV